MIQNNYIVFGFSFLFALLCLYFLITSITSIFSINPIEKIDVIRKYDQAIYGINLICKDDVECFESLKIILDAAFEEKLKYVKSNFRI